MASQKNIITNAALTELINRIKSECGNDNIPVASDTINGLMSTDDKGKLDLISETVIYEVHLDISQCTTNDDGTATLIVSLEQCTSDWNPIICLNSSSATSDTFSAMYTCFNSIFSCITSDGALTFKFLELPTEPTSGIDVYIYVVNAGFYSETPVGALDELTERVDTLESTVNNPDTLTSKLFTVVSTF